MTDSGWSGFTPLRSYEPEPDGTQIVAQHFPYDGPHSPQRTEAALEAVSVLVRYVNNATHTPAGIGMAPQVYNALSQLSGAAGGLPQLCEQLSSWARDTIADDTVRHDEHRDDPDRGEHAGQEAAGRAHEYLRQASIAATLLRDTLTQAHTELAHLCHDLPEEGDH